ncbi:calcineurin-like phosphoesterase family protein [Carboxylicivirga sp. A043]|uniref:calcineurin-like phosphoesterase family protein n=1 Tax=Carboxylicivirga litoralis TaxID=2816963 RepID=UPI0021CB8887|nr:calcineurin-like phosphoesterase family protein [Carboxylicivirga sp. A043]MCU4155834.1 calcineurin-like phosphoesterase family protein [Carboxylicivirga sp. A043]
MKYCFLLLFIINSLFLRAGNEVVTGVVFIDENNNGLYDKGEAPLEGVLVSNQLEVVASDKKGRYQLPLRDGAFIYVVKPKGYQVITDSLNIPRYFYFHHTNGAPKNLTYKGVEPTGVAPETIDFPLIPMEEKKRFRMLALGDPQTPNDQTLDYFRDGSVADMFRHQADFYMIHGDIADDNLDIYPREKAIMSQLGIPGYHVPGNHDVNYKSEHRNNDFETYRKAFGPDYFSFDYGDVHFIVLNNISYKGWNQEQNKRGHYVGKLDSVQLEWLKNDLNHVPNDRLIVINSHIPFVEDDTQKESIISLHDLLIERTKVLSLSGHIHQVKTWQLNKENYWEYAGSHEGVNVGATCGSWWSNPKDENGIPVSTCQDGSPKGYFVFDFEGSNYSYEFIPIHYDDAFQIRISSPLGRIKQEELDSSKIVINWFVGKPHQKVEVRIDGGEPFLMKNFYGNDPFYEQTLGIRKTVPDWPPRAAKSSHMWKLPLPGNLRKGTHRIEVTAYGENDKVFKAYKIIEIE